MKPSGPFIGRPLPRFEDLRLVRGAGRFTDDVSLDGQAYAVFVRAPHAHARIVRIDTQRARAGAGVLAVLTGADYAADGLNGIQQMPVPNDAIDYRRPAFVPSAERGVLDEPHWPLARERVRYVGEAIAVVVAQTPAAARDAADAVEVAYQVLPAVVDVRAAIAPGAPTIWPAASDNIAAEGENGDRAATLAALAAADVVIEQVFCNQRIASAQMEPRSAIGSYAREEDRYTLVTGSQGVHRQRHGLAKALNVAPERVRVITPDVGGGFGSRNNLHPEQVVVAWAARRIGRPVRWTSERTEAFLTDYQGRDIVTTARLALDRSGRIHALALDLLGNVGAQTVSYVWLHNAMRIATTVYDVPAAWARARAVMTNTVPTAPFRGAGRPEMTSVIEPLLDMAARRLGIDRVDIRRRNLIPRAALPYRSAMGLTYDSGMFAANMERALEVADWSGFPRRRAEASRRGRLAGIGVANYVESPVGMPHERVEVAVGADGGVTLTVGTQSSGQGHETTFAQVMADQLGVAPEAVRFVSGDTDLIATGGGTHSDRSMRLAGTLMVEASGKIIAQAGRVAAALLAGDAAAIAFRDGLFAAGDGNRRLSLADVAHAVEHDAAVPAELRAPLKATATFTGRIPAYPTGAAVCEVEIDPQSGAVEVRAYVSVDDAGTPVNPLILHGQVHGGVAQGLGQALMECFVHAPDSGEVLSGSFLDYGIPRAAALPPFAIELAADPTAGNPLGVKGGGEAGITPSPAACMNAILDALAPFGVEHLDMPATPERVWLALRAARG